MKNSFLFIKCVIVFLAIAAFSCKKRDFGHLSNIDAKDASSKSYTKSSSRVASSGSCVEDTGDPSAYDSILVPTILGYHLVNHPYSLAHMQQAYINLYGTASGVAVTNNYVRFKPSTPEQLSVLEDLDIDLFDHPLDYDVIQDGDYYDDGVTPAEEIPWLYAVVDINFTPPPGITYEVLEQIHIPILAAVENEAFALTGNPYDDPNCVASGASIQNTQTQTIICQKQRCPEGYIWDPGLCKCVLNTNCPVGYHWDGSTCVPDGPPPPTPSRQPSGTITVTDNNNGNITHRGVRNARVIAKRFFKVERTFTNNNGEFFLTKEFNKVHLFAEFENEQASIDHFVRQSFGKC